MKSNSPSVIVVRIARRAQQRLVEWLAAFQITLLGLVLLADGDTLPHSNTFAFFRGLISENTLGTLFFVLGATRVCGLIVNGARQDVTPWIRAIGAFIGFMLFLGMWVGFVVVWADGDTPAVGLAIYLPSAVAELAAIFYSVRDAKVYHDSHGSS